MVASVEFGSHACSVGAAEEITPSHDETGAVYSESAKLLISRMVLR